MENFQNKKIQKNILYKAIKGNRTFVLNACIFLKRLPQINAILKSIFITFKLENRKIHIICIFET